MKDDHKKIIDAIEKAQIEIWEKEKTIRKLGTKENPYFLYVSQRIYNYLKENNLIDKDDMYLAYKGWTKAVIVGLKEGEISIGT